MHVASVLNFLKDIGVRIVNLHVTWVSSVTSPSITKHVFPETKGNYYARKFVYYTVIHLFLYCTMSYPLHVRNTFQFINNSVAIHNHNQQQ
jgi:hypothetical protein